MQNFLWWMVPPKTMRNQRSNSVVSTGAQVASAANLKCGGPWFKPLRWAPLTRGTRKGIKRNMMKVGLIFFAMTQFYGKKCPAQLLWYQNTVHGFTRLFSSRCIT